MNDQLAWHHDEGHDSGYFHTYDSLVIDQDFYPPRKVHVFLPRDYDFNHRGYPVVYMNDGNTAFWPDGLSPYSWQVPATLKALYAQRKISPVIIVAIHPLNRSHEYLHVKEFSALFKQQEGGGLAEYSDYLVRLKHFIDCSYNTLRGREFTTIVGSSHGGLAAFYTGCLHGEHFGNVGALSPSFWVGGVFNLRQTFLVDSVKSFLSPDNQNRPRIWIDWGLKHVGGFHNFFIESQAAKWAEEMVKLLQQDYGYTVNTDLFYYADPLGGHDERAWAYRLSLIFEKYYSDPP
ncbi:alpha/beta hydrolase [Leptolyngbya sp. PCC 6406]|uniref:alpha/beta hydrolase n=1 Tax=Leptolyngbya sp. PCC 6406 TaxID=1173264 RepID=UPI001CEC8D1A|nr:alpha/beta hydrolase-fold protein [Leptolyngbya sp. PCC 6406]